MGFIDSIKSFYFRAFDFRTRSSRSEFWYVFLAQILIFLLIEFIPSFLFLDLLVSAINILIFLPQASLTVRRFHDVGLSGWWVLCLPIGLSCLCGAAVYLDSYFRKCCLCRPTSSGSSVDYFYIPDV